MNIEDTVKRRVAEAVIAEAVSAEREACAIVAEDYGHEDFEVWGDAMGKVLERDLAIAAAIRARSTTQGEGRDPTNPFAPLDNHGWLAAPQPSASPSQEAVEAAAANMYGKNWNGPEDKRPGEKMKNVWRAYARDAIVGFVATLPCPSQEGGMREALIEATAELIYLRKYGKDGAVWWANESKDVWRDMARAALAHDGGKGAGE